MLTVIETPTFSRLAADYWTEDERGAFAAFIASHPEVGNVVPGSGGLRSLISKAGRYGGTYAHRDRLITRRSCRRWLQRTVS